MEGLLKMNELSLNNEMKNNMNLMQIRKKAKETSERELIHEAIRARNFSGADTLRQGMNLIDFALRVNRGVL